jgi:flagellar protein FliJ
MAQFRFQLETVLRHRRVVEDQRQRELAQGLRQRMILHDQLRLMQQTITQSKRDLGTGLTGKVNMDQVASFARYNSQVTQRAQAIVVRLVAVEKQIDAARLRLLEASKARKALELLRDRHMQLWQQEQERLETAILDELAVQGFNRQQAAEVVS